MVAAASLLQTRPGIMPPPRYSVGKGRAAVKVDHRGTVDLDKAQANALFKLVKGRSYVGSLRLGERDILTGAIRVIPSTAQRVAFGETVGDHHAQSGIDAAVPTEAVIFQHGENGSVVADDGHIEDASGTGQRDTALR